MGLKGYWAITAALMTALFGVAFSTFGHAGPWTVAVVAVGLLVACWLVCRLAILSAPDVDKPVR